MRSPMRLLSTGVIALSLVASSCSDTTGNEADDPRSGVEGVLLASSLRPFDGCDDYLDWAQTSAVDSGYGYIGPMVLEDGFSADASASAPVAESSQRNSAEAGKATAEDQGPATTVTDLASEGERADDSAEDGDSGTNNQEAGVDEADLTKTDGKRVVSAIDGQLHVTNLVDGLPYPGGTVELPNTQAQSVFLRDDTAFVIGYVNDITNAIEPSFRGDLSSSYFSELTAVWEIDLSGEPTIVDGQNIEGSFVTGRMVGDTMRLVLQDNPTPVAIQEFNNQYDFGSDAGSDGEAYDQGLDEAISETTVQDWLPQQIRQGVETEPLVDCTNVYRPADFAGFGTTSIMTIPGSLADMSVTAVAAGSETVYASETTLYLATNAWGQQEDFVEPDIVGPDTTRWGPTSSSTEIHAIDIAGDKPATYVASGSIEGRTLNQYSLSEHDGNLRIATTLDGTESNNWESHSGITVLSRDGNELREIGSLDGLGPNEEIQSVRFMGSTGYVVTFRQTDPFYVIDLSDPTSPKAVGELKLPGFSAYLHPVGDGLILGVGFDGDDQGLTGGAKVSLFDASDPAAPTEVAQWVRANTQFSVTYDPHAFNFNAERGLALLPTEPGYDQGAGAPPGLVVLKIGTSSITEVGAIDHADRSPSPEVVVPTTLPPSTTPSTTSTTTAPSTTAPSTTAPSTTVGTTTSTIAGKPGDVSNEASSSTPIGSTTDSDPIPTGPIPTEPFPLEPAPPLPLDYLDPYEQQIIRAFFVGDIIISISRNGVGAHDPSTFEALGFAAF